ncbi:hypothetical protein EIN_056870 [Entamoeba invadens IP1]|uniref:hypothetical protein n=1 Tax=Entamoeba invadens IP1 TaxID=370355 RepID=UPI0002C3F3D5|nr:hypothetical protein EIN_056870 [Entamoeba invadens IP1]ELP93302.1 hypothetical protein EIN_056870 [Entamoeba invadens IP1]|eukprot:XP_004260073.1 hypothetical protein EIN_056870 [Entamoeba invadens IP1]
MKNTKKPTKNFSDTFDSHRKMLSTLITILQKQGKLNQQLIDTQQETKDKDTISSIEKNENDNKEAFEKIKSDVSKGETDVFYVGPFQKANMLKIKGEISDYFSRTRGFFSVADIDVMDNSYIMFGSVNSGIYKKRKGIVTKSGVQLLQTLDQLKIFGECQSAFEKADGTKHVFYSDPIAYFYSQRTALK